MWRPEEGQGGDPVRALMGLLAAWLAAWSLPSLALSGHGARNAPPKATAASPKERLGR